MTHQTRDTAAVKACCEDIETRAYNGSPDKVPHEVDGVLFVGRLRIDLFIVPAHAWVIGKQLIEFLQALHLVLPGFAGMVWDGVVDQDLSEYCSRGSVWVCLCGHCGEMENGC